MAQKRADASSDDDEVSVKRQSTVSPNRDLSFFDLPTPEQRKNAQALHRDSSSRLRGLPRDMFDFYFTSKYLRKQVIQSYKSFLGQLRALKDVKKDSIIYLGERDNDLHFAVFRFHVRQVGSSQSFVLYIVKLKPSGHVTMICNARWQEEVVLNIDSFAPYGRIIDISPTEYAYQIFDKSLIFTVAKNGLVRDMIEEPDLSLIESFIEEQRCHVETARTMFRGYDTTMEGLENEILVLSEDQRHIVATNNYNESIAIYLIDKSGEIDNTLIFLNRISLEVPLDPFVSSAVPRPDRSIAVLSVDEMGSVHSMRIF